MDINQHAISTTYSRVTSLLGAVSDKKPKLQKLLSGFKAERLGNLIEKRIKCQFKCETDNLIVAYSLFALRLGYVELRSDNALKPSLVQSD